MVGDPQSRILPEDRELDRGLRGDVSPSRSARRNGKDTQYSAFDHEKPPMQARPALILSRRMVRLEKTTQTLCRPHLTRREAATFFVVALAQISDIPDKTTYHATAVAIRTSHHGCCITIARHGGYPSPENL
jgi:hypothetical protein